MLKAGSQYSIYCTRHVTTEGQYFQQAQMRYDAGIESGYILHRDASEPIEKIMTSGCDATRTVYTLVKNIY